MSFSKNVIHVYTDGACLRNGRPDAAAGVGVYFGPRDPRNVSEPLEGYPQTNQRAELTAILRALDITSEDDRPLTLYSDSQYSMKCITEWLPKWRQNGFKTSRGDDVKNLDLIEPIDDMIQERGRYGFRFEYVRSHEGDEGNEMADQLARKGALMDSY